MNKTQAHAGKIFLLAVFCAVIIVALPSAASAEYLFLKDGSILEGTVTNETDAAVTVSPGRGRVRSIARRDLLRTLYRSDFLYRQSVKMYSGETFEGFLVNETEDTYVFRKELFSVSERSVKKDEVINLRKKELYTLEGKKKQVFSILDFTPALTLRGAIVIPLEKFGTIYRLGYGGGLGFDFSAIRKTGWGIGIDAECRYMKGVKSATWGIIGTVTMRAYYEFRAASWLGIAPAVSGGYSFNHIEYDYRSPYNNMSALFPYPAIPFYRRIVRNTYKPVLYAGAEFLFGPWKKVSLVIDARYGAIFEKKSVMHLCEVTPGVRFIF